MIDPSVIGSDWFGAVGYLSKRSIDFIGLINDGNTKTGLSHV